MNLWEYEGKKIKVTFKDGDVLEGVARDYTSALDNTGEIYAGEETICIEDIEFSEKEIKKIEILS